MTLSYTKIIENIFITSVLCALAFSVPVSAQAAQILVPSADQATGSWTTTPGFSKIDDDSTISATGDGVTFDSEAAGNNTNTSFYDFQLAAGSDPALSTGHVLRVRWNHNQSGRTMQGTFELWQGVPGVGTQIAVLQVTDVTITENEATLTLTGGQADSITDYSNLYGRLWGRGTSGGPGRSLIVDLAELEIPDAPAGNPPLVTTNFAGNVGATSATLFGTIVDTGGDAVTQHGFAISTDPVLQSGVSTSSLGGYSGIGTFNAFVSGLLNDEAYYYRAYAENGAGMSYGAIQTFTTGNTQVKRKMRLFEGGRIVLREGRIILY